MDFPRVKSQKAWHEVGRHRLLLCSQLPQDKGVFVAAEMLRSMNMT